jgi:hypothetical protein
MFFINTDDRDSLPGVKNFQESLNFFSGKSGAKNRKKMEIRKNLDKKNWKSGKRCFIAKNYSMIIITANSLFDIFSVFIENDQAVLYHKGKNNKNLNN